MNDTLTARDIFLRALERKKVPRPATGSATSIATIDLMKQADAAFPNAHVDPVIMASLAKAGSDIIGFDNVMPLFSVCHESVAIGCHPDWGEIDRMPDCRGGIQNITEPCTIPAGFIDHQACQVPLEALRLLKVDIGEKTAIVGKVFGPWTLGYHVFGIEEFLISTIIEPDAVVRRIRELLPVTIEFALAQIDAGADALCLADHATRDLCSPETYRNFLFDIHCELHERIPCPLILHICGDTSDRIEYIRETGIECFHFDSKVPADRARQLAEDKLALMGGTSNFRVIREGTPPVIAADVREKIDNKIDIIGPECAVPLDAPCENMRYLADYVKSATIH